MKKPNWRKIKLFQKSHNQFWSCQESCRVLVMENIDPTKSFTIIDARNAGKNTLFSTEIRFPSIKKLQVPGIWCALQDAEQKWVFLQIMEKIKKFPAPIHPHPPKNPEEGRNFFDKLKKAVRKYPMKTVYEDICAKNSSKIPPPLLLWKVAFIELDRKNFRKF